MFPKQMVTRLIVWIWYWQCDILIDPLQQASHVPIPHRTFIDWKCSNVSSTWSIRMDIIFKVYQNLELHIPRQCIGCTYSVLSGMYLHCVVRHVLTLRCQACTYKIYTHSFVLRKSCITCYTYQSNVWVVLTVCCQALITFMTTVLCSAKVALLVNTYQGIVLNVFMICLSCNCW